MGQYSICAEVVGILTTLVVQNGCVCATIALRCFVVLLLRKGDSCVSIYWLVPLQFSLLILAFVILIAGVVGSLSFSSSGFGAGWSEGARGWFAIPVIAMACACSFLLLLLGGILLLLVDISRNLASVRPVSQGSPFVTTPPPGLVPLEPAEAIAPVSEVVVPAAAAAVVTRAVVSEPQAEAADATAEGVAGDASVEASAGVGAGTGVAAVSTAAVAAAVVAAASDADAVEVGVPVMASDESVQYPQIEIAEDDSVMAAEIEPPAEVVPAEPAPPKTRKPRVRAPKPVVGATVAAVAAGAALTDRAGSEEPSVSDAPAAEEISDLDASVEALRTGVDALEAPTAEPETRPEPRLPGADEAARIAAALTALKGETGAPAQRQRKPAKLSFRLAYVEGIGEVYASKLNEVGLRTTEDLLTRGATRKGRQEIAELSGISSTLILRWVNHVDLFRLRGVGEEYAQLLEASGVDTVVELAQRNATNLQVKLAEVNAEKRLVRQVPVLSQVVRWIEEAKTLPRVITY